MSTSQKRYHGNNDGLSCTSYYHQQQHHHSYRQERQQGHRDSEMILQQAPIQGSGGVGVGPTMAANPGGSGYPMHQMPGSYQEPSYSNDFQFQGYCPPQQESPSSSRCPTVSQRDMFSVPDPTYIQPRHRHSAMVSYGSTDPNLYHRDYPPGSYSGSRNPQSAMELSMVPFNNNNNNNDPFVPSYMKKSHMGSCCTHPSSSSAASLFYENRPESRLSWHSPMLRPPEHMLHLCPSSLSNSNGREARNRAEKNRRDKLNSSIQELSGMVPHVAESPRRVDKTAVLRFSAHGLRVDYVFGKSVTTNQNQLRLRSESTESFLKILDGFIVTMTCRGQIVLVTSNVEQYLGHCQTDLYGQNITNITHPDDHNFLKQQLIPTDLETLFDLHPLENGEPRPRSKEEEEMIDRKLRADRRDFTIRMARAGPRSEPTVYEIVRIDGSFRRADLAPRGTKANTFPVGLPMIRRARTRDESFFPPHAMSGNDIVLVGRAQIIKPPQICDRLIEACKSEYKTRHLIDGRIVQVDQRISVVAGYLTDEVSGLSPFTFMHKDDVRWVMVALRQMYDYSQPYGESCYRLITRNGQFIYLKTRGYLEIDKDTNKVHSFCCINTLVTEDEGKRLVNEMKRKFSVIINPEEMPVSDSEEQSVENPHQIERAVLNLITNLASATSEMTDDSVRETASPSLVAEEVVPGDTRSSVDSMSSIASPRSGLLGEKWVPDHRKTGSPPLAIIAPKHSTIKPSITKSVQVIVQASGSLKINSPLTKSATPKPKIFSSSTSTTTTYSENLVNSRENLGIESSDVNNSRPSVLQRTTSIKTISSNSPSNPFQTVIKSETIIDSRFPETCTKSTNNNQGVGDIGGDSQLLRIKQEIMNDPLSSPASSTVSSLSCENQIGSNPSSCVGFNTVDLFEVGQDQTSNEDEPSRNVIVLKRSQERDSDMYTAKRRRSSQHGLEDIPTISLHDEQSDRNSPFGADLAVSNSDLMKVLPSSFDAIDRSLMQIENTTESLRDQCLLMDNATTTQIRGRAGSSRSSDQLAEIIEEQQEQREILYSIKQEYENRLNQDDPDVCFPDFVGSNLSAVPSANNEQNEDDDDENDLLLNEDEQRQILSDPILLDNIGSFDDTDFKPD